VKLVGEDMMNKIILHMKGHVYSANKHEFKKIREAYDMAWKGNMETWIWKSETDTLTAVYERVDDVTKDAFLIWESPHENTDFKDAFLDYWLEIPGVEKVDKIDTRDDKEKVELFRNWEMMNKPNVEMMRRPTVTAPKGAPEGLIKVAMREFEEKRLEKLEELELSEEDVIG